MIYQKLTPALLSTLLVDFTANGLLKYESLISPIGTIEIIRHCISINKGIVSLFIAEIENTSWKVLAYGIYARVVFVSEIVLVRTVFTHELVLAISDTSTTRA